MADPAFDAEDIERLFTYHQPTQEQVAKLAAIRHSAKSLAACIAVNCPNNADTVAAMRLLRQAVQTANASIVIPSR